jgi:hypothetical protein
MIYYTTKNRSKNKMKVTKIYVVRVQARDEWGSRNLDEAFFKLEKAQKFIESRGDNPKQFSPYYYESSEYRYYIDKLSIHGKRR